MTMANIFTDEFTGSGLISTAVYENFSPVSGEPGNEIAFLMGNLPDLQTLIGGIKPGVEIHILEPLGDGVAEMVSILNGRSALDAIHIFSHGASGSLALGTTTLNSNTLLDHQAQLAELGSHLTSTGDLLLYGCNVAQGADGQAFIESIARTTGADVAASTDLTGAASLGGDWVLEAQTGLIDVAPTQPLAYNFMLNTATAKPYTQVESDTGTTILDSAAGMGAYGLNSTPGTTATKVIFSSINAQAGLTLVVKSTAGAWIGCGVPTSTYFAGGNSDTDGNTTPGIFVDYGVKVDWGIVANGATLSWTAATDVPDGGLGGASVWRDYTVTITTLAPANTAPLASNGTLNVNEGSSNSINLATLVTDGQTASSSLTYSGTGVSGTSMSYSAGTNAGLKGTYNVANQSYTVTDPGPLSANGTVYIYVTYADDPTTWGSGPTNQNWITSGTNSYQLSGASDPDDNVNYSIVSGAPNWMHISGGQIYGNVAPEFAGQTYNLTVRASGSTSQDRTFSITTGTAAQLNDLPTASTGSQTVAEDAPAHLTFAVGNFNFADLDNSAGLSSSVNGAALVSIRIDSRTSHGTLTLSDVAVTSSQVILAADIANLKFTPTTDYSGSDSYTYSVNDGIGWSASPTTMNITVTPSNDAPVLVDGVPVLGGISEDATTDANVGNLVSDLISRTGDGGTKTGMTDVDTLNNSGAGNAPESVGMGIAIHSTTINGPSIGGVWQYKLASGGGWTPFGSVSDNAALLLKSTDSVRFLPDAKNGQNASFDYYAWDQFSGSAGSTANVILANRGGSTAFSTASDSASITVTDVNDAPTIVKPAAQTVAEDATVSITGISFSDVDIVNRNDSDFTNDNLNATMSVLHGTITLAGTTGITVDAGADVSGSVTITGSLTAINTAIATLIYAPGTNYSGAETLSLSVNDIGNVGSGGVKTTTDTLAITVTPTNDAPVLVDGRPTLTAITENDTNNAGNLVSDLISRTGGGVNPGDKTGITDVDTLNNGGLGNVPEYVGLGIAIITATNGNSVAVDGVLSNHGTGNGYWEYSINNGVNWTAIGTVSSSSALLLSSTDKVRFIPDTANGTMGTLNYYLWDAANSTTHATRVDVTTRGDATPYSVLSDIATLVVSNVNDAPVLDLDGNNSSTATGSSADSSVASFIKEFLVRGAAVSIADTDMTITDVDSTGGVTGPIVYDTVASATVAITAGATDNLFGTTYETLTAASATVPGSLGTITIANILIQPLTYLHQMKYPAAWAPLPSPTAVPPASASAASAPGQNTRTSSRPSPTRTPTPTPIRVRVQSPFPSPTAPLLAVRRPRSVPPAPSPTSGHPRWTLTAWRSVLPIPPRTPRGARRSRSPRPMPQ